VYDLWIDAAEEGYAEIALSPDFRRVYGDLVNSQMRVRKLIQDEIERIAISFGMPSRTELNSVHKRMAEMRRRMASLEEALARAEEAAQPRATGGQSPEPASSAAPKAKAQPRKAVKTGGFASKLAASRSKSRKKGGR